MRVLFGRIFNLFSGPAAPHRRSPVMETDQGGATNDGQTFFQIEQILQMVQFSGIVCSR